MENLYQVLLLIISLAPVNMPDLNSGNFLHKGSFADPGNIRRNRIPPNKRQLLTKTTITGSIYLKIDSVALLPFYVRILIFN